MGNRATGWTPERRKRQAELIHRWRPWAKSTGPTSPGGKAAVSQNAFTGAESSKLRAVIKELNQVMRQQKSGLG